MADDSLAATKQEVGQLKVRQEAADARLKEVQETAASGGARMAAVESRCEDLEATLQGAESDRKTWQKAMSRSHRQLERACAALQEAATDHPKATEEDLSALRQTVERLEGWHQGVLQWQRRAEVERKALAEWQKMFEDRYISLEQSHSVAGERDEAAQAALRGLEDKVAAVEKAHHALATEAVGLKAFRQEVADGRTFLTQQAATMQQAVEDLRCELQGHVDTHSAALLMLDEAFRQLETAVNGLNQRTSLVEDSNAQLRRQSADLLGSLQTVTERLDAAREELRLRLQQTADTLGAAAARAKQETVDRLSKCEQLLESHGLDLGIVQNDQREVQDSLQGVQARAEELRRATTDSAAAVVRTVQADVEGRLAGLRAAVERLEGAVEAVDGRGQATHSLSLTLRDWLQDAQDRCALRSELEERCTHLTGGQRALREELYRTETDLTRKLALAVEASGQEMAQLRALLKRAPHTHAVHGLLVSQHSLPL
eukprot:EG_transcript_8226